MARFAVYLVATGYVTDVLLLPVGVSFAFLTVGTGAGDPHPLRHAVVAVLARGRRLARVLRRGGGGRHHHTWGHG